MNILDNKQFEKYVTLRRSVYKVKFEDVLETSKSNLSNRKYTLSDIHLESFIVTLKYINLKKKLEYKRSTIKTNYLILIQLLIIFQDIW